MVSSRVQNTGQNRLPLPSPTSWAPITITMKDRPRMMQPMDIFATEDGSLPCLFCQSQKRSRKGAKRKMKKGLADWNHVEEAQEGQLAFSSAHVCIVLPCCS